MGAVNFSMPVARHPRIFGAKLTTANTVFDGTGAKATLIDCDAEDYPNGLILSSIQAKVTDSGASTATMIQIFLVDPGASTGTSGDDV